jgi:hypothetical protein
VGERTRPKSEEAAGEGRGPLTSVAAAAAITDLLTIDDWPAELRAAVRQHGTAVVYAEGMRALGFPPTWAMTGREVAAVRRSLPELKR